jgi:Cellulase (glycosyl hydrolase family 5)
VKRFLLVFLVALALPAPASAGGPTMLIGATEDAVRQPTLVGAKAQMDLLRLAGFNAVRVTQFWAPDQTAPSADDLAVLQNVVDAAKLDGVTVMITVTNFGNRTTPLTLEARDQFASYAAALARALPEVRYFVIGNEPNINRYWLPQFNPDGSDAAAPAYEALLAEAYDALKAVSPRIVVLGGAVSPRGGDIPDTIRPTHSPTTFIQDMGAAYRASGRTTPIMDGLAFHPYEDNSSIAPETGRHPNSKTIAIADYDKLVAVLGQAFDGTPQRGTTLAIFYTEFGVETQIPAAKASLYTGIEPEAVKPVPADVQGDYYRQAIGLAFCQPTVRSISLFHTIDEPDLNRWQSGLFYVDGKAKASLPAVKTAIAEAHRGVVAQCPGMRLRVRVPVFRPAASPRPLVTFRCDLDCEYVLTARRGRTVVRRTGEAIGNLDQRVVLGRLKPGRYLLRLEATATLNPGPTRSVGARLVVPQK